MKEGKVGPRDRLGEAVVWQASLHRAPRPERWPDSAKVTTKLLRETGNPICLASWHMALLLPNQLSHHPPLPHSQGGISTRSSGRYPGAFFLLALRQIVTNGSAALLGYEG